MVIAQRLNLVAMCAAFALVGAVVLGLFLLGVARSRIAKRNRAPES